MALTDPKDTLTYHQSRVLTSNRDMSNVPLHLVTKALQEYKNADIYSGTIPEREALWFYGMNHGMALIASTYDVLQPLDEWSLKWVSKYHEFMVQKSLRAFYYLILICTREARHNKSLTANKSEMVAKFGAETANWFAMSGGENQIHTKLMSKPPKTTIGNFVECIRWQFYNSSWNGGYGGKAWGAVTDCLARFVNGEFTAEMMLDTVWTLAHNNGPIFNKGHFYGMYSSHLLRILDIQRSGQIPQAILTDPKVADFVTPDMTAAFKSLKENYPKDIGDYVDWYVVEALGSVNKYHADKKEQLALHGISEKATEAEKQAAQIAKAKQDAEIAAKKAEAEKKKKEQEEFAKTWFTIMPGQNVKKVEIIREAA